ncbi:MAG: GGDEF domain-containing protein, partial [Dehalococcoidia bacterium]|nr:GGDEF domain-containing protein [Dehalococcoidia bacterium]
MALGNAISVTLANARLFEQTYRQAERDGLTELLNRQAVDARYERMVHRAMTTGQPFSVVLIDLDGLKAINDTFGHRAGDDALRTFARILANRLTADDVAGRYGGDEFMALLAGKDALEAEAWVAAVLRDVDAFNAEQRYPFPIAISVGVAGWTEGPDPVTAADRKLYRQKRRRQSPFGAGPTEAERAASDLLQGMRRVLGAPWAGVVRFDLSFPLSWLAISGAAELRIDPAGLRETLERGIRLQQPRNDGLTLVASPCWQADRVAGALVALVPAERAAEAESTVADFAHAAAVLLSAPTGRNGAVAQVARLTALYDLARS